MEIYAKVENNKLITAYNGYNGVTGLADSPELCLSNGFVPYDAVEIAQYFAGQRELQEDGTLRDITQNSEYIAEQKSITKANIVKEYVQKLSEFDTMWSRNVSMGKKTQAEMVSARSEIQSELVTKLNEV